MLINEVCKKCKLTKKAVEYYSEQGLIKPTVMENGYRQFSENDVLKLRRIAILRGLGLSIANIRVILEKNDLSMLHDVLRKKEYELEDTQVKLELMKQLVNTQNWDSIGERLEGLQQKESILIRILDKFPGCFGKLTCSHFAIFLDEPATTPEQQEALTEIVRFLDNVNITIPGDLQEYFDEVFTNTDISVFQNASENLVCAIGDPEQFIKDNEEIIEQYQEIVASEEYKATPAYKLREFLEQLFRENGYNDVFIPAMRRLSPSYREYYKALEAADNVFKEQLSNLNNH